MLVETNTGVTIWTVPDAPAVLEVNEAGPCAKPICVRVPIAAMPIVHSAPIAVTLTMAETVATPPAPTTPRGTEMLPTGGAEHAPNKQTLAKPSNGTGPPPPMIVPAWLCTVSWIPLTGVTAGSVMGSTTPVAAKGDAGRANVVRCDPGLVRVATPEPAIVTGGSTGVMANVKLPENGRTEALEAAAHRAVAARTTQNGRRDAWAFPPR